MPTSLDIERLPSSPLAGAGRVGERLGPYRLVEEIGQGGMGRVYLAYRDADYFRRRVAVKIAQRVGPPDVAERFRSERQILGALHHPHIARLLDGGITAEGTAYLVLEYVEGEPINRYCDARRLGIEERLRILRELCAAVHYAHSHQVVHCDIKPANVLVTPEGTAKLLDFGIAELLEPRRLAQVPVPSIKRFRPLTPDYASPEQLRGESLTPASDVYSLGVLLYELLTGCRPLRLEDQGSVFERVVSEVEPEPPSRAARWPAKSATGGTPEERSRNRGTTPDGLRRRLEGDLDDIARMALSKAPADRYPSADQLADDLRRACDPAWAQLYPAWPSWSASDSWA